MMNASIHRSLPGGKDNQNPVVALTIEINGAIKKIRGRDAWALIELVTGGIVGVTPIEQPAPRWSHYIFKLRRAGIIIETIDERHSGSFAGSHARYLFRSPLHVIKTVRQVDAKTKRRDGTQMSEAREFLQIQQFVAACRQQWPGAKIVLRPNQDGGQIGAGAPITPNPHPKE
jgi:hypothetical protein